MLVRELMKTHVTVTDVFETLAHAADLMDLYQVGGLPVLDGEERLAGYLSEGDVWRALGPAAADGSLAATECETASPADQPAASAMTTPAVFAVETWEATRAAALLFERGLKRLPVVSEEGRVTGTINRIDVIQAIFEGTIGPCIETTAGTRKGLRADRSIRPYIRRNR